MSDEVSEQLERDLDALRRAMLHRCAATGRLAPDTLARLTAVLPAAPAGRRVPGGPARRPAAVGTARR